MYTYFLGQIHARQKGAFRRLGKNRIQKPPVNRGQFSIIGVDDVLQIILCRH
jgi:hypothetical protein